MAVSLRMSGSCVARAINGAKVQRGGLGIGGTGTKVLSSVEELCSLTCETDFFAREQIVRSGVGISASLQ